jgi:exonuclease SbcC
MKPTRLKLVGAKGVLYGLGLNELEVDLTSLRPGIVGIVGPTGSGKTTIIDNMTPYLRLASRDGALAKHFCMKKSRRELDFVHEGNAYTSRIYIDAMTGSMEAYLTRNGTPLNDGKIKTYKAAVENLLGSEDVFFRSIFTAQGSEPLAKLTAGTAKKVFLEVFGITQYDRYAEAAKTRGDAVERDLIAARAVLGSAEETVAHIPRLELELGERTAAVTKKRNTLESLEKVLASKQRTLTHEREEAANDKQARLRESEAHEAWLTLASKRDERLEEIKKRIEGLHWQIGVDKSTIASFDDTLARESAIAADLNELEELDKQILVQEEEFEARRVRAAIVQKERENLDRSLHQMRSATATMKMALVKAENDRESKSLKAIDHRKQKEQERQRLGVQAALIDGVPCNDQPVLVDSCKLLSSARTARATTIELDKLLEQPIEHFESLFQVQQSRAKVTEAEAAVARAQQDEGGVRQKLEGLIDPTTAERTQEHQKALVRKTELKPSLLHEQREKLSEAKHQKETLTASIAQDEAELVQLSEETRRLEKDEDVARAKVKWDGLKVDGERQDHESLALQIEREVAGLDRDVRDNRQSLTMEEVAEGSIRTRLKELRELKASVVGDRTKVTGLTQDLERWRYVQRACQKDGIPALELDAAGPELSRIVNDLLGSTFGSDFRVAFETTRRSADKKFDVEDFQIRVVRPQGPCLLEDVSGGQRVLVERAIYDAFAVCSTHRSGRRFGSTFADEVDSALDGDLRARFFQMLKRSLELGEREQMFLITHSVEIRDLLDQAIIVDPKTSSVRVEGRAA